MEQTYQYEWIIPVPLPVPMLIGLGLILFPTATKNLRCMWAFPSILLLNIVMDFSTNLSIRQINSNSIYQYIWSWTLDNYFSFEFGYLIDPLYIFGGLVGMCSYLLVRLRLRFFSARHSACATALAECLTAAKTNSKYSSSYSSYSSSMERSG